VATVPSQGGQQADFKFKQLAAFDANKFLEDVKTGIYPLTAYGLDYQLTKNQPNRPLVEAQHTLQANSYELSSTQNSILSGNTSINKSSSSKSSSSSTSPLQSLSQQQFMSTLNDNTAAHDQMIANFDLNQPSAGLEIDMETLTLNSEIMSSLPKQFVTTSNATSSQISTTNSSQASTPIPMHLEMNQQIINTVQSQIQPVIPISSSPQNMTSSFMESQQQQQQQGVLSQPHTTFATNPNNNSNPNFNNLNNLSNAHSRTQSPVLINTNNGPTTNTNNTILNSNGAILMSNNNANNQGVYGDSSNNASEPHMEQQLSARQLETRLARKIEINVLLDEALKIYKVIRIPS
jgi:hypothetical protein